MSQRVENRAKKQTQTTRTCGREGGGDPQKTNRHVAFHSIPVPATASNSVCLCFPIHVTFHSGIQHIPKIKFVDWVKRKACDSVQTTKNIYCLTTSASFVSTLPVTVKAIESPCTLFPCHLCFFVFVFQIPLYAHYRSK